MGRLLCKIMLYYENDYRGSLRKAMSFGIRLFRVFMGHIQMDGMSTLWSDGHIGVLGRPWHKFSKIFLHISILLPVMGKELIWEDLW